MNDSVTGWNGEKINIRVIHCGNWRNEIIETVSYINIFHYL
mgnify:CR=1 FL=1